MKDPYRFFRVEARELCDELTRGIVEMTRDPDRAAREVRSREMLRAAHTLKGAARVVGLSAIADRCHALEDALLAAHEGGRGPGSGSDDLLRCIDDIATRVATLDQQPAPSGAAPAAPAGTIDPDTLDAALTALEGARREVSALRRGLGQLDAARALEGRGRDLDRSLRRFSQRFEAGLASLDRRLLGLEARAHDLRLLPASLALATLERAARDAARALDKQVVFESRGGEIRLDAGVLGLLREALLHVVQNAVDHGIERPAERRARGLPEAGTITVELSRAGHEVSVICRDDGRGIDAEALRRAAAARGSRGTDAVALAFEPGVSTRAEVSATAGRGVGLDAVRAIVARLHGSVSASSPPGGGAAFRITVPAALSSLPVLLFEAGEQQASVPLAAARRVVRVRPEDLSSMGGHPVVMIAGRALPRLDLEAWLGVAGREPVRFVVLIETSSGAAALGVGRVLGAANQVVEALPPAAGCSAVLGASLDHDGVPRPVLDPAALVRAARAPRPALAPAEPARRRVLVVDDSITARMLEQSVLASAGYEVDTASSGEEALRLARERTHDLFLVDVEMPGMSGFELVARTRAERALSRVPAIIVSTRSSAEDRRRGVQAGARAWVTKEQITERAFLDLVRGLSR